MRQSIDIWLKFNQLLFGQRCLLCATPHRERFGLCQACDSDLPRLPAAHCPQCALPSAGDLCGHCLKSPPAFDHTYALFSYHFPIDAMLHRYKYQHLLSLGDTFAGLLADKLAGGGRPDLILPMPLHPQRLRERGFNQSTELARLLGRKLEIPVDTNACERIKHAPPQASLPLKQRVKNMQAAFSSRRRYDGLHVALVDDVMTTGASLNALAKTVKAAGAARVECWVVARTLPR